MKKIFFLIVLTFLVLSLPVLSYAQDQSPASLTINISPKDAVNAGCGASAPGTRVNSSSQTISLSPGRIFNVTADFGCGYKGSTSGDCSGTADAGASYNCNVTYTKNSNDNPDTNNSNLLIVRVAKRITDFVWQLFALLALVMIVIAGMLFLFARGDPEKVKIARGAFLWGIVGIVVAILAYSIINVLMIVLGV